jgi:Na+-translocating ferredoxin:NAD+ oxidoreductase RnfG subunit
MPRTLTIFTIAALAALTASAKVLLTRDDALAKAFPNAQVKRVEVFLTKDQIARAQNAAGRKLDKKIVYRYEAYVDDQLVGVAYFDAHRVRTLPEILMIAVTPAGTIKEIDVLSFKEPMEYLPKRRWYEQFLNQKLDQDLRVGRDIDGVVGATLTARATSQAVRRTLAIHSVLEPLSTP